MRTLKIKKNYGVSKLFTEAVMDKMDMFQSRSGKITNLDGGI